MSEDERARIVEISPKKEVVWEFHGSKFGFNNGTRAERYGLNYCKKFNLMSSP